MPKKTTSEQNRLSSRLTRYAKVSTAVGGLAAKVAGEKYLGLKLDRSKHAGDLRSALGGLKGPLMKVAQMLATIPDAVPKEYAEELSQLQSDAPPMGWAFVKRRMAAELGPNWQSRFQSFEQTAASAASLGQVHKAVTLDGEQVACKLQYPDMASAVEADLGQLKIILSLFEKMDSAIRTKQIYAEITDRLREELDYEREAEALKMFATMLDGQEGVRVPKVHDDLSTKRLLTMEWVEGQKLLTFKGAPLKTRNLLAQRLFKAWYVPFYHYGVIHGDPHPGNYTATPDHRLNLLDFGCVRVFDPALVEGVIALYRALQADDEAAIVAAYESWGFKGLKKEVVEILTIWARFVYGPVLDDRVRLVDETESGLYGRATARKVHFALRDAGGVEVPRQFVFMDRAAIGLGSMFLHLRAELNWYEMFNELVEGVDRKQLAKRQSKLLSGVNHEFSY